MRGEIPVSHESAAPHRRWYGKRPLVDRCSPSSRGARHLRRDFGPVATVRTIGPVLTALLAHGSAGLAGDGVPGGLLYAAVVAGSVIGAVGLRARGAATPVGGPAVPTLSVDGAEAGRWPGDGLPTPVRLAGQVLGVALLALVLAVGWFGSDLSGLNPMPLLLVAVVWWTVPLLAWILGDWWRVVDPHDAIAAAIDRVRGRPTPPVGPAASDDEAGDWWVPAALLATFAWMLTCWLDGLAPRHLAAWVSALTVVMVVGAVRGGRGWVRRNSPLAVLCGTIAAASPVAWDGGRVRLRSPLRGLARRAGGRRSFAVLAVVLGATVWEAVAGTRWWADITGGSTGARSTLWSTFGLVWCTVGVAGAWVLVARLAEVTAAPSGGEELHEPLAADLVAALGPLAAVGVFVHQLATWLTYVQDLVVLGLDPFSEGWDLFGTSSWRTNEELLSAGVRSWIQIVLLGLALGVMLVAGWDRMASRVGTAVARAGWTLASWTAGSGSVALWLLLGA